MQHDRDQSRINLLKSLLRQEGIVEHPKELSFPLHHQMQSLQDGKTREGQPKKARRKDFDEDAKPRVSSRPPSALEVSTARMHKEALIQILRGENETLRSQLEASMGENERLRQQMREQTQEALDRNSALQGLVQQYINQQNQEKEWARFEQQHASASGNAPNIVFANLSDDVILSLLSKELHNRRQGTTTSALGHDHGCLQQQERPNEPMKQLASSLIRSTKSASVVASEDSGQPLLSQPPPEIMCSNPASHSMPRRINAERLIRAQLEFEHLQEELNAIKRRDRG